MYFCPNIVTIEAQGLQLSAEDFLFLWKTFECVARGEIQLETEDGYNLLLIINTFERELFEVLSIILSKERDESCSCSYFILL